MKLLIKIRYCIRDLHHLFKKCLSGVGHRPTLADYHDQATLKGFNKNPLVFLRWVSLDDVFSQVFSAFFWCFVDFLPKKPGRFWNCLAMVPGAWCQLQPMSLVRSEVGKGPSVHPTQRNCGHIFSGWNDEIWSDAWILSDILDIFSYVIRIRI